MKKIVDYIKLIFKTLADCVIPAVPVLVGVGMLKVLLIILGSDVLGLLSETDNTFIVLNFVADAGYYFLPIYIAVASAERFGSNKYIGALMGGMLLSPSFVNLVNEGTTLSVFKLPVATTAYGNQMLPSIIIVFIESYIYKIIEKIVPERLGSVFVPMLTILIMVPIAFCLIGPIGVFLSDCLANGILALSNIGPIGNAIYTAALPFIVIFGLGGANLTAILTLMSNGCDPIAFFSNVLYNTILGITVLAVFLKDKKSETLAAFIASTVGGSSEAAIFTVALKDIKALFSVCAGCFVAGLLSGIFNIKSFAVGSFGIIGIVATIGQGSSILFAAICMLIGSIISFSLCLVLHKKQ